MAKKYGLAKSKGEERVLELLTNKLIEVGKWPNLRKDFTCSYQTASSRILTFQFWKNNPKMSNIEYFTLILYYSDKIEHIKSGNKINDIINRGCELLGLINDVSDWSTASIAWWSSLYRYYERIGNKDATYRCCILWLDALTQSPNGPSENTLNKYMKFLEEDEERQLGRKAIDDLTDYIEEQYNSMIQRGESEETYREYIHAVCEYATKIQETLPEEYYPAIKAILQLDGIVKIPKRARIRQGTFDYCYSGAEEGDKEAQLIVAQAYREGEYVPMNIRLANFWEGVANNKFVE